MSSRRMRPVAALTLALVAAPFLAATAVAATTGSARPAEAAAAEPGSGLTPIEALAKLAATVEAAAPAGATAAAPAPLPPPPPPPPVSDASTWVWPGNGPITSPFGSRWGRMHEGVDIDAAFGSAVVAAQRGTVVTAGWASNGYGRVVEIDHGEGILSRYAHLSSIDVTVGQVVAQGTRVGAVGASGSVTAAHLHYEVRIGGIARNPTAYLPSGGASAAGNPG